MLCLESSFLVDWFRGQDHAHEFLEKRDASERILVPTPVLHELVRGALATESYPDTPADIYTELAYAEFIPLTVGGAEDAAKIRVSLAAQGIQIGAFDSLIAGVARDAGAVLVATDQHYDRVDGLELLTPRTDSNY